MTGIGRQKWWKQEETTYAENMAQEQRSFSKYKFKKYYILYICVGLHTKAFLLSSK